MTKAPEQISILSSARFSPLQRLLYPREAACLPSRCCVSSPCFSSALFWHRRRHPRDSVGRVGVSFLVESRSWQRRGPSTAPRDPESAFSSPQRRRFLATRPTISVAASQCRIPSGTLSHATRPHALPAPSDASLTQISRFFSLWSHNLDRFFKRSPTTIPPVRSTTLMVSLSQKVR